MNRFIVLGVLGFSITLAVLIGQRLSDQAMAVVVGSVIGVAASMPMSAVVLWLTLRQSQLAQQNTVAARSDLTPREEQPRVIVVQPPVAPPALYPNSMNSYHAMPSPASLAYGRPPREFKVVGEEDLIHESRDALV
ncbi:MAG: hypothetical protein HY259_15325 [Chloroflexi bacterium]|nr:hypothetical protein [Chloroflexota bacterium]